MKALIYYGPGELKIEERPMPSAGNGEVIVKVMRAGICGSDLTAYLHDGLGVGILKKGQFGHDGQFGHEMVGIVHEIGSGIEDIAIGDRVFLNPTVCKKSGMLGCDIAGAFSEYTVVEEAAYGHNLFKLADDVSFDQAVTIEPLCVGTHGKNCVEVKPYENVVIYGAGTIGLCALNSLTAVGCQRPVVVDTNEQRLKLVSKMGGVPFLAGGDKDIKEFLIHHFGEVRNPFGQKKTDVDVFIDCAGAPPILNEMISLAKPGARVSVVAVYKQDTAFDAAGFLGNEMQIKGACGYTMPDIIEAFHNINTHRISMEQIITHRFKQDDAAEAFKTAADPLSGAIKVVIDYE